MGVDINGGKSMVNPWLIHGWFMVNVWETYGWYMGIDVPSGND